MNSITELLNLKDSDIIISDISIQGTTKTLTLETTPYTRFCPSCGFKMHSRGTKKRTVKHPILQDTYDYEDALFRIDYRLKEFRDLKEIYIQFNNRNAGNLVKAREELDELIPLYQSCEHEIFRDFGKFEALRSRLS